MCRQSVTPCLVKLPALAGLAGLPLTERLVRLPDPRRPRGVRHPFVSVLLIAACAVLAGARSYAAIGQWAAEAPQDTLTRLGARVATALAVRIPPSGATIRRVFSAACPGGLVDLLGTDPAGTDALAVDGKTARGSRRRAAPAAHLLAAMTRRGETVAQLRVPDKTNEIACFTRLLSPYDLAGVVVTADALHTQRGHVHFLHEKGARFLLVVKDNQPTLFKTLRSLPWKHVTARHADRDVGHGRRELRGVKALTVTGFGVDFPGVVQAARIMRFRTDATTGWLTRKTIYAVTDLASKEASPQRLGQLARSHWGIENQLHHARDRTFHEDDSKIRTRNLPRVMAGLRNHAISTLRRAGHRNIAAASATSPTGPTPGRSTSSACPDQQTHKITRLCNSPVRSRQAEFSTEADCSAPCRPPTGRCWC
ncbi:ISAs1 family transposase [Streptomyces sp. HNM0663]|uniref:ISAs1 family transposase n=1 Tax=Streptomyces chengmaiensis TaxID=3040919 RepID=A0ABT6HUQ1_9ACTN|nr:ISAs1 family transposase [Streptomyces chengmaiensis]MDH2392056.1 ISAs1 family transposase [Streptomyces chengmaiensis]